MNSEKREGIKEQSKFILKSFSRYIKYIIISIPFTIIVSSTSGIIALAVREAIDRGIKSKNFKFLTLIAVGIPFFFILRGVSRVLSQYLIRFANESVIRDLRAEIFKKMFYMPITKLQGSSEVISKMLADIEVLNNLPPTLISLIKNPINFMILSSIIIIMNYQLAIFSIIVLLITLTPIRYLSKKISKHSGRARSSADKIAEKIREIIQGAKVVRFYSHEKLEKEFNENLKNYRKSIVKSSVLSEIAPSISEVVGAIAAGIIILYGGYEVISGKMTEGEFLGFVVAFLSLWEPIKGTARSISDMSRFLPSIKRIMEIYETKIEDGKIEKKDFEYIEFRNASFSYGNKKVFDEISLKIKKGDIIGIIGESGIGKSTLVYMLLKLVEIERNSIFIDGIDIKDIKLSSLRELISVIEQNPFIIDDTVYNNILFANPNATKKDVIESARLAELIKDGDETFLMKKCGENGKNLSEGQKQRISIARAILKSSPIIIMDEPTSSLDPQTEKELISTFKKIINGKTAIIISHSPEFIKIAKRIFKIENRKIYEIKKDNQ